MTEQAPLPRAFGNYRLTAELGHDALGGVFRGLRLSGERDFVRLRIFESSEISEDALLDAIEANGEIHTFLKNPAIARGVEMDAVDGVPFLAWSEPSGRTLDALIQKATALGQSIPVGHALLIGEKIATALDHAYNTTIDGERTLHGLVWPGFVSISDDGETRLTGFGLASGFFSSMSRPRFTREVAAYLAPEERAQLAVGKNSDVYSVGVVLFQLLLGRLPSPSDPLADIKAASTGGSLTPETAAVLRTCLSPAEARYQSSGDLRRELGKILFSGPYSPSTFNLAFFLTGLFGAEIEEDNRARARESTPDFKKAPEPPRRVASDSVAGLSPAPADSSSGRRRPIAIGGALLVAAALAGTVFLISHRPARDPKPIVSIRSHPTSAPTPVPTSLPTTAMSESEFKEEVSRRVSMGLKSMEEQLQKSQQNARRAARAERSTKAEPESNATTPAAETITEENRPEPSPAPTHEAKPSLPPPTAALTTMTESAPVGNEKPADDAVQTAPKILRVVKPIYPPLALQAGIKGIVLLRVLVSEAGRPQQIDVLSGVGGGLTAAAVSAVRKWTFEPGRRNGQPVPGWTTIPIPFEP